MTTKTVDIAVAQATLPDLVRLANTGVEVVLTRESAPVARLISTTPAASARTAGLHVGAIHTSADFAAPTAR